MRHPFVVSATLLFLAAGCAGGAAAPVAPSRDGATLAAPLAAAFAEEAKGDPAKAIALYEDVLDGAVASNADAWQVAVVSAALDALVGRSVASLASITADSALVYRTEDPSLTRSDSLGREEREGGSIAARLAAAYAHAVGPFARGMIAEAMTELAEHRGDVADAARWREATGCALETTVVGPVDWAPVEGVVRPDPLAPYDAPLAATYRGPGSFAPSIPVWVERGHGCTVDVTTESSNAGVRDVVVDVDVPKGGRVGLLLRSAGAATLRAGGRLVIERAYEIGGDDASRYAWVDTRPGKLRLVARVGMDQEGEGVRIAAWDESGKPLRMHAPKPGEAADVPVSRGATLAYPDARSHNEKLAVALAALAMQDARSAEYLLEHDARAPDAAPDLALAYARSLEDARDLSLVHRVERTRNAYERVLATWPTAWEAILAHAWLKGVSRGPGDARFAELDDLRSARARLGASAPPILDAFELGSSGKEHLWDVAYAASDRLAKTLGHSSLFADATRVAFERSTADAVTFDCSVHPGSPRNRSSLSCYNALHAKGDMRGGLEELERLRALLGGVDLFLPLTLRDALALGDHADVDRAVRDMLPADVTLSDLYGLASVDPARGTPSPDTLDRLRAAIAVAHDAPLAIAPLFRVLREDPTAAFAGVAESVVQEDRARPFLPGAATAVLRHNERYDLSPSGVVHAIVFDVRRVNGTTDVEENAQAGAPQLNGRTSLRILRRRVLKRDGTVVEPDPNPGASQGHADLAQLEAGDVVEAIYEGWSVPLETGEIGIDTTDLLPDRTAVHDATVEIHLPAGLSPALWSHPLLGAPVREVGPGETILRWSLRDHLARRVEDGTPRMDRSVAVSLSTARWSEIGRGLPEAELERIDHDPAVLAWATSVVKDATATTERAKVDAVVAASGVAVKEGDPGELSDILYGHATGPQSTTARGILEDHEGSRTWLIVRALRELGIATELVVAENEPFSASADFPPHLGRFVHPLAVAHVHGAGGALESVPIDADVSGPPLPAGHISPELRGRLALHEDGTIAPLPAASTSSDPDEIDERLTVDAAGDARGTFTALLRGHGAQEIAEVLERTVGDARQKTLRGIVLAWVPYANVESIELSSKEGSWEVALRADVAIPGYAQAEGKGTATWMLPGLEVVHDVYPRGSSATLSATYATEGTRESALALTHAVQYHFHRRVELPLGATIARTASPVDTNSPPIVASRKLRVAPGATTAVEDDMRVEIPTGTVPADAYARFAEAAHRTDDAFLATTRVKLPAPKMPRTGP